MKKLLLKLLGSLIVAVFFISCGNGDNASISVQASQNTFEQIPTERTLSTDVLWVIDDSISMESYQNQIRAEFNSFMENFIVQDFNNIQIGITTTSAYQHLDFSQEEPDAKNDNSAYTAWNDKDNGFSASDKPCTKTVTTDCYDYEEDLERRFVDSEVSKSELKSTNCDVCNGPNGEIKMGREISILSNPLLDELRLICDDESGNANGECETLNAVSGELESATGFKKFLDLFDKIMDKVGTNGSPYERAFQSIQAVRLNPKNVDFFRNNSHLAIVIVSDEDDTSAPYKHEDDGFFGEKCIKSDLLGILHCNNAYPPSYYKNFLELLSNDILGVSVHNIALNPKEGYKNLPIEASEDSSTVVLKGEPGELDLNGIFSVKTLEMYKSGMNDNYSDNTVTYEYRPIPYVLGGNGRRIFPYWVNNSNLIECRTAEIPRGTLNTIPRYFGRRTTELAELTGGVVASLCSDFSVSLKDIAKKIVQRTVEFFLGDDVPSQQTLDEGLIFITVKKPGKSTFEAVNRDTSRKNGWDYNATNNSVVFFGEAIPIEGSKVSVAFDRQSL